MRTEKIVFGIFILGFILRMFHIPGGSILPVLSMALLSLFYFPAGFYFLSDKKIDNKTVGFSVVSGFTLSITVLGILFKIMDWTGAFFMLVTGLVSLLPIAIISYVNYTKPKLEELQNYYKNIFIRVMIALIFGLLLFVF
ncbi:GldL-related protein [Flavobacterium terrisoli]|uniref:GldL-related protein n=1 Tax=Flavobacterium terrisoli TaxID=3242195 RepID=UPI002543EFA8|nr:hypothetical protein [Flavobacterium buctense]